MKQGVNPIFDQAPSSGMQYTAKQTTDNASGLSLVFGQTRKCKLQHSSRLYNGSKLTLLVGARIRQDRDTYQGVKNVGLCSGGNDDGVKVLDAEEVQDCRTQLICILDFY